MKRKQLKDLKSAVKQVASFKPNTVLSKPEKEPSAEELRQKWKLVRR